MNIIKKIKKILLKKKEIFKFHSLLSNTIKVKDKVINELIQYKKNKKPIINY